MERTPIPEVRIDLYNLNRFYVDDTSMHPMARNSSRMLRALNWAHLLLHQRRQWLMIEPTPQVEVEAVPADIHEEPTIPAHLSLEMESLVVPPVPQWAQPVVPAAADAVIPPTQPAPQEQAAQSEAAPQATGSVQPAGVATPVQSEPSEEAVPTKPAEAGAPAECVQPRTPSVLEASKANETLGKALEPEKPEPKAPAPVLTPPEHPKAPVPTSEQTKAPAPTSEQPKASVSSPKHLCLCLSSPKHLCLRLSSAKPKIQTLWLQLRANLIATSPPDRTLELAGLQALMGQQKQREMQNPRVAVAPIQVETPQLTVNWSTHRKEGMRLKRLLEESQEGAKYPHMVELWNKGSSESWQP